MWKPTTEILHYVKQICLLVQVAGSPTNISQLQKPKTRKWVYSKTFWSILKVCRVKMAAHVTCPCNNKEHQNYLSILHTKKWSCLQHTKCQNILLYNLLLKLNSKDQSYKINYCVNHIQLNRLEQLFWYTTTISPILKFLLLPSHFWHSCKDCRYSFFPRDKNSLAMSWICWKSFLQHIWGLEKSPGGGKNTFDFMVRMFTGANAADLLDYWKLLRSGA